MTNETRQPNFGECITFLSTVDSLPSQEKIYNRFKLRQAYDYVSQCSGVPIWWLVQVSFSGDETPESLHLAYSCWTEANQSLDSSTSIQ